MMLPHHQEASLKVLLCFISLQHSFKVGIRECLLADDLLLSCTLYPDYSYLEIKPAPQGFIFGQFVRQTPATKLTLPQYGFTGAWKQLMRLLLRCNLLSQLDLQELPRGHPIFNFTFPAIDHRMPLWLSVQDVNNCVSRWNPILFGLLPHMSEEIMATDLSKVGNKHFAKFLPLVSKLTLLPGNYQGARSD